MIRVGVNGYGTIGRRVADAILKQSDMRLIGITKVKPDYKAIIAREKGIQIYASDERSLQSFKSSGIQANGTLNDLLREVDVIVDATPDEVGASNKPVYERAGIKAIFQGGEKHSLTGLSFVAQCNFEQARGKSMVRVVSCNTTALCRVLNGIDRSIGISRARAILARRAADPDEYNKGPIDSVVLDPPTVPSHHADDVRSVMNGIDIITMAVKVPTTHMHLHSLVITLKRDTSRDEVLSILDNEPRIVMVDAKSGFRSTANIIDLAREMNRERSDIYEAVVWRDSVSVFGNELYLFLAVHQEAIVVPENIDAIRALNGSYNREESMKMTDSSLGIKGKI